MSDTVSVKEHERRDVIFDASNLSFSSSVGTEFTMVKECDRVCEIFWNVTKRHSDLKLRQKCTVTR